MMNNEFYAVCERAQFLSSTKVQEDYGKTELAYFKTLEEAEDFLRNLDLYPHEYEKTTYKNSRFARILTYHRDKGKDPCHRRIQYIFFIEKKVFFGNIRN